MRHGFAQAQLNLGIYYRYGAGIGEDHAEALRYFRAAAEADDVNSQYYLAACWFSKAAAKQPEFVWKLGRYIC